ncbi:Neurogenic locus Notch protein [Eufriesea mexicana]|uniref:Neurogenic locus Notch protein n=1 Tax=Eufriesea mexicana TaxID=516756 RepID=A0A310SJ08_9HYME|nr:Neurogenic locus Notch protein [Eufriesea mexicana]
MADAAPRNYASKAVSDDDKCSVSAFLFTGLLCHLDDACTSNPCHQGAICDTSPINGSFTCSCATGYKGVDCSEDIDECEQDADAELSTVSLALNHRVWHQFPFQTPIFHKAAIESTPNQVILAPN